MEDAFSELCNDNNNEEKSDIVKSSGNNNENNLQRPKVSEKFPYKQPSPRLDYAESKQQQNNPNSNSNSSSSSYQSPSKPPTNNRGSGQGSGSGQGAIAIQTQQNQYTKPFTPTYYNLQDPPTPVGRLSDRINHLRQKCLDGLGKDVFNQACRFIQDFEEVCCSIYL